MEPIDLKWLKGTKGTPFMGIGSLEADILAIVWDDKQATVRDVTRPCASSARSPIRPS